MRRPRDGGFWKPARLDETVIFWMRGGVMVEMRLGSTGDHLRRIDFGFAKLSASSRRQGLQTYNGIEGVIYIHPWSQPNGTQVAK